MGVRVGISGEGWCRALPGFQEERPGNKELTKKTALVRQNRRNTDSE